MKRNSPKIKDSSLLGVNAEPTARPPALLHLLTTVFGDRTLYPLFSLRVYQHSTTGGTLFYPLGVLVGSIPASAVASTRQKS